MTHDFAKSLLRATIIGLMTITGGYILNLEPISITYGFACAIFYAIYMN